MSSSFYSDPAYRAKQSKITKLKWRAGIYNRKLKSDKRVCIRIECSNNFIVKPHDKQKYCSSRCAGLVNSPNRKVTLESRRKISRANAGRPNPHKGISKATKVAISCLTCAEEVLLVPYLARRRKYCSNTCAMKAIGGQTTSPRASKGKSGIRPDISPSICFYSTWEANIARIYTYQGVEWQYAPRSLI